MWRKDLSVSSAYRAFAVTLSACLAYSASAAGVNAVGSSLADALKQWQLSSGFSQRPGRVYRGPNPKRDPIFRGGRWTTKTLADLRAIEVERRAAAGLDLFAATELFLIAQTGGGGEGGGGGASDETPGSGGGPGVGGNTGGGSYNQSSGSAGSAGTVNTNTGNRLATYPLVGWSARGDLAVGFTLYHNSLGNYPGEVGVGWSHSYEVKLNYTSGSSAIVHWGDGTEEPFTESSGTFTPAVGFYDSLVHNGDGTWTLTTKHKAVFGFRSDGHLLTIKDRANNQVTVARATDGKIQTVTDPSGRQLTFTYNGTSGKLDSVTAPSSKTWSFTRDSNGDLTTIAYPLLNSVGYSRTFAYNSTHDITSEVDLRGKTWTYGYDTGERMTWWKTPSPLLEETDYTYGTSSTVITHPGGQTETHNYSSGSIASEVDGAGFSNAYTWNSSKQLTQYTDRRGKVWQMTYDLAGNRLTLKNPLLKTWTDTFNSDNDLTKVKDPLNHETTVNVNSQGKVTSVVDAMTRTVRTNTYDGYGQLATTKNGANETITVSPNTNGDITDVATPLNKHTTISYDGYGRPTGVTTPTGIAEQIDYDDWGRPIKVTHPGGSHLDVAYDAEGNVTGVTDELSRASSYAYDAAGRMTAATNPKSETETYTYNSNGWATAVQNGRGKTRTYEHTNRGEVKKLTMPDGAIEQWTYDGSGNLTGYTNPLTQTIGYAYDDAGRLTTVDYPTGTDTAFTYDDANRRLTMADATGTTTWNYNDANQLTSIVQPNGSGGTYTVSFAPNAAGRRDSMTDPSGTTNYYYDSAGRLDHLTNPLSETTTWTYDDDSRVTRVTYHPGIYDAYSYDSRSRLVTIDTKNSSNTTTRARSYAYDAASQMTTQTIDGIATTYGYDSAGQLASESRSGYSASYTYDGNGNRLTKTLNGTTDNYSYDDGDKLLDIKVSGVAVKTFSYDAAGRTTQIATSSYTRNFSYDYEGRISQITGLPTTNTFTYNGFDTRTKKVDSAGTANFKRMGAGVTAPVVDDSSATYTPGISERRSGTTTYMHAGLKTLDQRTNSSQANTGTKRYDAFGNVVSSTGSWASPWGYAGKFGYQSGEDAEIMLLGHRYYDASTGRFLTKDPAKDGRNWFAYCSNNPATHHDKTGLQYEIEAWGNQFTQGIVEAVSDLEEWFGGRDDIGPHGEPVRIGGWTALMQRDGVALTINGTVHLNDESDWARYKDDLWWSAHEIRHTEQVDSFCGGSSIIFAISIIAQYIALMSHDGAPFEKDANNAADERYNDYWQPGVRAFIKPI